MTLDVTDATTTTVPVMATSILLWAFISSLARLRRVEEASPGDPGRFLLSSMVLIVTGEIPGPILHCSRCHTLDTRALDDLMCSLPDVARCVCLCFLPIHSGHQVRWTYQPGSHRRKVTQDFSFLIHLPSAVRALIFVARRIQPFLSLVDREVEFCVLTN